MKKISVSFLLIATFFLMTACTMTSSQEIPLVIYDMRDDYMQDFERQIQLAAGNKFDVVTYDSQHSQLTQNEQVIELIRQEPPLIVVNPVDRLSVHAMIQEAKAYNVPIIFINREPLQEDLELYEHTYYIGADAKESARLQASIIMDLLGGDPTQLNHYDVNGDGKIQVVILMGQQGHQDAEQRTRYVIETLEDAGYELDLLDIRVADFDRDLAYQEMISLINLYGSSIELVIANNDAMAIGAVEALMEREMIEDSSDKGYVDHLIDPYVPVVGIDGLDEAVDLIKTGFLHGTVINDSAAMAESLIELIEIVYTNQPIDNYSFPIVDNHYIWIEYRKFILESE